MQKLISKNIGGKQVILSRYQNRNSSLNMRKIKKGLNFAYLNVIF
jgi:hypothetical protein